MSIELNENVPGIADIKRPPSTDFPVAELTDRELLEEIALSMRTVGAALRQLQQVGPMGLMKMVMGGGK